MFIGKPICIVAATIIFLVCLAAAKDKKVKIKNKIALIGLASGLAAIVWSL